jgi:hypothetical protein
MSLSVKLLAEGHENRSAGAFQEGRGEIITVIDDRPEVEVRM